MLVSIKNQNFIAIYAPTSASSRIARPALQRLGDYHLGLVTLSATHLEAIVGGIPYTCRLDLVIADALPADIVLGADWYHSRVALSARAPSPRKFCSAALLPVNVNLANHITPLDEAQSHSSGSPAPPLPTPSSRIQSSPAPPSPSIDASVLSSEAEASVGLSILHDNFFSVNKSRCRTSVFDGNLQKVQHLMDLHGLRDPPENIVECRRILINHLLTGSCADFAIHPANGAHTACRKICQDSKHASELTISVLRDLVSAKASEFSTDRLALVCSCFGIFTQDRDSRRRLHLQNNLRMKLAALEATPSSATDISETFNALAKKSKPALLSLCALHAISLPTKCTKPALRDALFAHFNSGACQNVQSDGCRHVCDDWKASDYTGADFDIFFLTSIVKKATRDVLREILEKRGISFDPDDGLAKLRRTLKHHIHTLRKGKGSKPGSYDEKS
ncbi:hypothetical protein C8F01DRAFT_1088221 [Mycena amicta]|nr:hypothetical protein C8F01DRAFT_1088221 [Mycena amicta]